jgi:hypothetical protein
MHLQRLRFVLIGSLSLLLVTTAVLPVLAGDTCTTGGEQGLNLPELEPGQVRAISRDGTWVLVKPLDDPAGPYYGQYTEWDRWLLTHFDPALDFSSIPPG